MRAIVITRAGGPDVLALRDVPEPTPGECEIRVRVAATALNRADLLQRRGHHPAPAGAPAAVPGLEYAGTVDRLGPGASRWHDGDRVMGIVGGGAYAEYVVVHEDEALPVPPGLPLAAAAAVPEAFLTAHDGFAQLRLHAGETLLVHALPSGVGTAALQLAHARGAAIIGTSRSAWKLARVAELKLGGSAAFHAVHVDDAGGQDDALQADARAPWVDAVREHAGRHGVDCVLDLVGGDYLPGNLEVLAPRGRILVVGLVAGATAELDMRTLLRKRAWLAGTVMRNRSLTEKIAVARAFQADALAGFAAGALRPVIDCTMSLEAAAEAHRRMEENANVGKIVLTV